MKAKILQFPQKPKRDYDAKLDRCEKCNGAEYYAFVAEKKTQIICTHCSTPYTSY